MIRFLKNYVNQRRERSEQKRLQRERKREKESFLEEISRRPGGGLFCYVLLAHMATFDKDKEADKPYTREFPDSLSYVKKLVRETDELQKDPVKLRKVMWEACPTYEI